MQGHTDSGLPPSPAAVAMIVFMLMDRIRGHKSRVSSACAGAVVGLVVITPACGFVTVGGAACMGVIGGVVCNLAMALFDHLRNKYVDDVTDVFPVHGVGGTVGMICTSLFATPTVNTYGYNGLLYGEGGPAHFWKTLVAMVGLILYICITSYLCYFVTNLFITFRATDMEMLMGLDVSKHGEKAFGAGAPGDINGSVHGGTTATGDQIVHVNPQMLKGQL
jgi:Amt family ammonium transporter